jgi:hypothetical protein
MLVPLAIFLQTEAKVCMRLVHTNKELKNLQHVEVEGDPVNFRLRNSAVISLTRNFL